VHRFAPRRRYTEQERKSMKTRNIRFRLTVGRLRRLVIYKPLAALLAILLAPAVSWMESGGGDAAQPFQARAQIAVQGCAATGNSIIQSYCGNGTGIYYNDLVQLESDAVTAYLATHGLPASNAPLIYQYGRGDLRDAIRGEMMTLLKAIILEPPSQRTAHEQNLYNWLQGLVQQNEIAEYTAALNNFNSFLSDPCHFTLEPALAAQYNLKYDGTPFCFSGTQTSIFQPMYPASSYFLAYGMEQSYGKPASTYPEFAGLVAGTNIGESEAFNDLAITGGVVGVVTAIPVIQILILNAYAIALFAGESIPTAVAAAASTVGAIAGSVGGGLALSIYAGPLGIVLICILSGVLAGLELANNQQVQNDLNNVQGELVQAEHTPPDLGSFLQDSVGASKLRMTLVAQTLPDVPSSATLPAHQASDLNFSISAGSPTVTPTLTYQDWAGNIWSAQTYGGWFVQTCGSAPTQCNQTGSLIASINYVDSSGADWIASRFGNNFTVIKSNPASTDAPCPANASGLSPVPTSGNFNACSSYVSPSIHLEDGSGNPVTVSLTTNAPPAFSGPASLAFGPSVPKTATIAVTGNPTPIVCLQSSNLPGNFTLNGGSCGTGSFQLVFDGSAIAPQGNYSLTLKASNSVASTTQAFTVNVSPQLGIISPNSMTVTTGAPTSFTVVATGVPTPQLSIDGVPLGGLTFQDNHNGTATISGIDTSVLTFLDCEVNVLTNTPCGIVATNSQGTVRQAFTIYVNPEPSAIVAGPNGATFYAGVPNQVLLVSTGAITPVSWSWFFGEGPYPWLILQDNGNGTATLSGTPPLGTTGTFNALILPLAANSIGVGNTFPVTILNAPVFTSPNTAAFTAGTNGNFAISANIGAISTPNSMPQGLFFSSAGNSATISGIPAVGTGGQYLLALTDNAATNGTATQNLTLNVYEAPKITSPNLVVLLAGQPASVAVTSSGFPQVSARVVPANSGPPTSVSQGNGMYFTTSGLPTSLTANNLNGAGLATGTLTISGTPQASDVGTHKIQIAAQNGVGTPGQQTLTLQVLPANLSSSVSLLTNWVLSRDASNNVVATVVVTNDGLAAEQNVAITRATIGAASGAVAPSQVASIAPGATATFEILFPGASLGTSGSAGVLSLSGTYAGGSFNNAGRIVLP
jgi:hypothetical protein